MFNPPFSNADLEALRRLREEDLKRLELDAYKREIRSVRIALLVNLGALSLNVGFAASASALWAAALSGSAGLLSCWSAVRCFRMLRGAKRDHAQLLQGGAT